MTTKDKIKFYQLLGERIKAARNQSGFNQEAFAACLGLSRASIVNIEKGRQHPPIHMLWVIASVLKIEVEQLLPSFRSDEKVSADLEKVINKEFKDSKTDKETQKIIKSFVTKFVIEKQAT